MPDMDLPNIHDGFVLELAVWGELSEGISQDDLDGNDLLRLVAPYGKANERCFVQVYAESQPSFFTVMLGSKRKFVEGGQPTVNAKRPEVLRLLRRFEGREVTSKVRGTVLLDRDRLSEKGLVPRTSVVVPTEKQVATVVAITYEFDGMSVERISWELKENNQIEVKIEFPLEQREVRSDYLTSSLETLIETVQRLILE